MYGSSAKLIQKVLDEYKCVAHNSFEALEGFFIFMHCMQCRSALFSLLFSVIVILCGRDEDTEVKKRRVFSQTLCSINSADI